MRILITGGTGFIGSHLLPRLMADHHELVLFSRDARRARRMFPMAEIIAHWHELHGRVDAVINLAGEPIADRPWSAARKHLLRESRITLSQQMVIRLGQLQQTPAVVLQGSAIGYYGEGDSVMDERSPAGQDFAAQLCADWEAVVQPLAAAGSRVCYLRTGIVLGADGGMLQRLLLPFRLGLGGRLGNGQQMLSWIHIEDWVGAALYLLQQPHLNGPFNLTAPNSVNNATFTRCLAKALHRPAFMHVPAAVLRLLLGEMSQLLLGGQKVVPEHLKKSGYLFLYATLDDAMSHLVR